MATKQKFGTRIISAKKKKEEPETKIAKHQWKLLYIDMDQEYLKFLNTYAVNN